jgi:hypothetical protein
MRPTMEPVHPPDRLELSCDTSRKESGIYRPGIRRDVNCGLCGTRLLEGAVRCPICRTAVASPGKARIDLPQAEEKKKEVLTLERVGLRQAQKASGKGQKSMTLEDQLAELEREVGPLEGAEVEMEEHEPTYPEDVIQDLMKLPGMTREKAKMAYDLGYGDLETVLLGAMRGQKDAAALAKILTIRLKAGPVEKVHGAKVKCPSCKTVAPIADLCAVCGFRLRQASKLDKDEKVEAEIEKRAGDVLQALTFGAFFDGLPETLKRVIGGHADEILGNQKREQLIRAKLAEQIEAWRKKGFDAQPIETMMVADFPGLVRQGSAMLAEAPKEEAPAASPAPAPAPVPEKAAKGEVTPAEKPAAKPAAPSAAVKKAAAAQAKSKGKPAAVPEVVTPLVKPGSTRTPGWCSVCGEAWTRGAKECSACATPLKEQRTCGKCKIPLHPSMKHCPYDGK